MSNQIILNTVSNLEKELERAQKKYEKDGAALERKAMTTTIKISQMNVAHEMIAEGARITADLLASCEAIVRSLDVTCRPLLDKNPSAEAVGEVVRLMKEVNHTASHMNTAFTMSLNGQELGDVGAMKPMASMEAQVIQKFWETHYRMMPDYEIGEKRIAEKERKQKQAKQKEIDDFNDKSKSLSNKRDAHLKQQAEFKKHMDVVKEEAQKKVLIFENSLNKQIFEIEQKLKSDVDNEIKKIDTAIYQEQEALKAVSFFKFSEKKQKKENIAQLESKRVYISEPSYIETKIAPVKREAQEAVKKYQKAVDDYIANRFVRREISFDMIETKRQQRPITDAKEKEALHAIQNFWQTASEIQEYFLYDWSCQNVSRYLSRLVKDGYADKYEQNYRSYYALAGTPYTLTEELWEDNPSAGSCPEPPSLTLISK